mmetsp:Transcript_5060/g.11173  ORF Transcript_5060/g.11173 Transcript_5060/m.11173 type:complete len:268 (-) Transcript_5060:803-1606(-)
MAQIPQLGASIQTLLLRQAQRRGVYVVVPGVEPIAITARAHAVGRTALGVAIAGRDVVVAGGDGAGSQVASAAIAVFAGVPLGGGGRWRRRSDRGLQAVVGRAVLEQSAVRHPSVKERHPSHGLTRPVPRTASPGLALHPGAVVGIPQVKERVRLLVGLHQRRELRAGGPTGPVRVGQEDAVVENPEVITQHFNGLGLIGGDHPLGTDLRPRRHPQWTQRCPEIAPLCARAHRHALVGVVVPVCGGRHCGVVLPSVQGRARAGVVSV